MRKQKKIIERTQTIFKNANIPASLKDNILEQLEEEYSKYQTNRSPRQPFAASKAVVAYKAGIRDIIPLENTQYELEFGATMKALDICNLVHLLLGLGLNGDCLFSLKKDPLKVMVKRNKSRLSTVKDSLTSVLNSLRSEDNTKTTAKFNQLKAKLKREAEEVLIKRDNAMLSNLKDGLKGDYVPSALICGARHVENIGKELSKDFEVITYKITPKF